MEEEPTPEGQEPKVRANELLVGGPLAEMLGSVPLVDGQVRLLGYTDDRPGKMETMPNDGRLDTRCLVMAHLRPASWTAVTPDKAILGRMQTVQDVPEGKDELSISLGYRHPTRIENSQ